MEENISKALIMAAGVLLAIMIVSFGVYTFKYAANFAQNYEDTVSQTNTDIYNRKFEVYYRDNLTIYDIITVANLAKAINKENYAENVNAALHIQIQLTGVTTNLERIETYSEEKMIDLLEDQMYYKNSDKYELDESGKPQLKKFKCTGIKYGEISGKVEKMEFEAVPLGT